MTAPGPDTARTQRLQSFNLKHCKVPSAAGRPIPDGLVAIEVADHSVTIGWTEDNGSLGSTATIRDE